MSIIVDLANYKDQCETKQTKGIQYSHLNAWNVSPQSQNGENTFQSLTGQINLITEKL